MPAANAGVDKSVTTNAAASISAAASTDSDGEPLTFAWAQIGGPPVTLTDNDKAVATFTAPASPTTLAFRVTVTDPEGGTSADDITVTVKAPK
jgi:hypothetical protein